MRVMMRMGDENKVLDHGLRPRNYGEIPAADGRSDIRADCGDTVRVYLRIRQGRIEDVKFLTDGCFHTLAACSAATELIRGKTSGEAIHLSPRSILDSLRDMPEDHEHCADIAARAIREAVRHYILNTRGDGLSPYRKQR
jgi:nitrogen fixation protein NifU and related proteins